MSVTIFGASDDLIEVEGDVREEWNSHDDEIVTLSTGHRFELSFQSGWTIRVLDGDASVLSWGKREIHPEDDVVTVNANVRWVACQGSVEYSSRYSDVQHIEAELDEEHEWWHPDDREVILEVCKALIFQHGLSFQETYELIGRVMGAMANEYGD